MAAYMHGNLAVEERSSREGVVKETRRTVYRHKAIPVKEKLLYLFTILVCVAVAGMIIWRYAAIYEMNTKIQQLEQKIQTIQEENSGLQQEVRKLENPQRLKDEAQKLGLGPASDEQVNWIKVRSDALSDQSKVAVNK